MAESLRNYHFGEEGGDCTFISKWLSGEKKLVLTTSEANPVKLLIWKWELLKKDEKLTT